MLLPVSLALLASDPASSSSPNAPVLTPDSQILETYNDSLTTYQATSKTKVQDLRPLATQRGVTLDGALRAAPMLPMHLAGNPFENVWTGREKQGALRIDIGTYGPSEVDLAIPAKGFTWTVGRTFNARATDSGNSQYDSDGPMGKNWAISSQPEIVLYDDATDTKDVLYLVYRADAYVEFDRAATSSTEYKGKNGAAGCFHYAAGSPDTWEYTDQAGYVFTFFGFNTTSNTCNGQLWKIVDPDSNTAYIGDSTTASTAISNGYDGSGRVTKAYDPSDRRYTYTYTSTSYGGKTRLQSVVCETKSGGTWASPTGLTEIGRSEYSYYASGDSHGDGGDLKTVKLTVPLNNFAGESPSTNANDIRTKYYRYWEGSSDNVSNYNSSTNPGYVHALKYVYGFEGVRRYDWLDTTFDDDEFTETDANLVPYAESYFEYDSSHRIDLTWSNGQCGCGGATNGTYTYVYETNGSYTNNAGYDTTWSNRTVVAKPDGSYLTQYFDELGQGLSSVVTDIIPTSSSPAPQAWVTYVLRDANGCATQISEPDNVTGYTHNSGGNPSGAITISSSIGLLHKYTRTSSGDLAGFATVRLALTGTGGSAYYEGKTVWDGTTLTKTITDVKVVRPLVSAARKYPTLVTTDTGYEETSYSTTAWSSTLMPETVTTTLPAVSTGNNGSNTSNTHLVHYRKDGPVDFVKNEDATIDYYAYTDGQETTRIQDADTGSLSPPTGFSSSGTPLKNETSSSYTAQGLLSGQTLNALDSGGHRQPQTYRSALADRRMIVLEFPDLTSGPTTYYGPVRFRVLNQAGRLEASGTIALTSNNTTTAEYTFIDESQSDPLAGISLGTVAQMRTTMYEESGTRVTEDRAYFLIPGSGAGSAGTNYDSTTYGYDAMGRRWRVKEPSGTIRRTVFDSIGRQGEDWLGTNDHSFSGGESSGSDNMVKTRSVAYDAGSSGKNSQISSVTEFIEGSSTGQRVTTYTCDWRGRVIVEAPPTAPYIVYNYDNEGRKIARGLYSSSSGLTATTDPTSTSTNRMALSESVFDEMGRVWKTIRHEITQSNGTDADNVTSLSWYDSRGRVIEVRGEEYRKTAYDRLGRVTDEYVLAKTDDSGYSDASTVTGDIVLEQFETRHDGTRPDVILRVAIQRKHNDVDTGSGETTGSLDTDADSLPLKVTAANLKGRAQITANWYDQFGRLADTVEYGTYSGSDFDRSGLSVPSRSDSALRTTTAFNTDGTVDTVTDPRALVMKYAYDALGRSTKEIKNFVDGTPGPSTDEDVTVIYGYTNGLRTSLTADLPYPQTDQVTTYIYGTTTGTPSAMKVSTGHLLRAVKYPDSSNTGTTQADIDLSPGTSDVDVVSYAYNAQGQVTYQEDEAGTVLESVYDDSGRRTINKATSLGSGIDNAVLRVETGYDSLGRTSSIVQYDATSSGSATDGIAYTYDDWGNVASYAEDKDSAVSGGGNQYTTSYTWTKNAPTYGRYTVRKTALTMPDSRSISYTYGSSGGLHDDEASRVTTVVDGGTTLAQYDYLGAGTVVRTQLPEISSYSRVFDGSTPPAYVDLDTFNRITTSRWTKSPVTPPARDFYSVTLAYDADSNITVAVDNVHGSYHSMTAGYDVLYSMDNVNRLTEAKEGKLTASGSPATYSFSSGADVRRDEAWTLSHTGNWDVDQLDLNGDGIFTGAGELNDHRTHDVVNQLTSRDTDNNGSADYTLASDAAGNMTDDGKDYKYVYDAWNRLRKVEKTSNSALVAEYRYNGLSHRIAVHEDTNASGTVDGYDDWYYDAFDERWRMLARFVNGNTYSYEDFVPHQAGEDGQGGSSYIDLVICRDRDADLDVTHFREERNYYCQNWRADVSALVSTSGLQEWVKYSAYGTPIGIPGGDSNSDGKIDSTDRTNVQTWINGSTYDVRGDINLDGVVDATDKAALVAKTLGRGVLSTAGVVNRKGFAGYESLSGLNGGKYLGRNRVFASDLGRWASRDTMEYWDGLGISEYCKSSPVLYRDQQGALAGSSQSDSSKTKWTWLVEKWSGRRLTAKERALVNESSILELNDMRLAFNRANDEAGHQYGASAFQLNTSDNPDNSANRYLHCILACEEGRYHSERYGTDNNAGLKRALQWLNAHESEDQQSDDKHVKEDSDNDKKSNEMGLRCAYKILTGSGGSGPIGSDPCATCCRTKVDAPPPGGWQPDDPGPSPDIYGGMVPKPWWMSSLIPGGFLRQPPVGWQ